MSETALDDGSAVERWPGVWVRRVRWLIGCGTGATIERIDGSHWFTRELRATNPGGDVHYLACGGDHSHTPHDAHRAAWDFLAEPAGPAISARRL